MNPDAGATEAISGRRWRWLWLLALTPVLRFLVIRFSVPAGQPWRTACTTCGAPLLPEGDAWWAVSPMGRCGRCGQRLGARAGVVEVYAAIAVAAAVCSTSEIFVAAAATWWVLCAVPLTFVDLAVHRLPNPLTYAATAGVFGLLGVAAAVSGAWSAWFTALACAAAAGVFCLGLAMAPAGWGVGLGDAKLVLGVAGLPGWWGWGATFGTVFLSFVLVGVSGAFLLIFRGATRRTHFPWGPQLIAGTIAMLALQAIFGSA